MKILHFVKNTKKNISVIDSAIYVVMRYWNLISVMKIWNCDCDLENINYIDAQIFIYMFYVVCVLLLKYFISAQHKSQNDN